MAKNEMLTVPLTQAQRQFVKHVAEAESTSEAAVVRRLVAEAARKVVEEAARLEAAQQLPAPPPPFPVHVPVAHTPEAIAAAEARLAEILARKRGRWADDAKFLEAEITLAKRMSA